MSSVEGDDGGGDGGAAAGAGADEAARLFGSSDALDENTTLVRWASAALKHRLGASGVGLSARELWEASGIRSGQVSAPALLAQLRRSGASLCVHSDFDIWGFAICRRLSERFDCEPWMMDAANYERAIRRADHTGARLAQSGKKCRATPWDPRLKKAFGKRRLIVHEEFVLDDVLTAFSQLAQSLDPRN